MVTPELNLVLEHSLYTISKWESRWMKPFMGKNEKTDDEILDYVLCMDLSETLTLNDLSCIPSYEFKRIMDFMNSAMTATTFSEVDDASRSREIITSELIYYWMIALQIPLECEHWHLNRLMTLIKICNIKNAPPKKQNMSKTLAKQRELNKQRRMSTSSTG